jgi:TniQ
VAGESVDSWLEAIARRYAIPFGLIVTASGVSPTPQTRPGWLDLAESDLASISAATAVELESVRALTLHRYHDHLPSNHDWRRLKRALWVRNNSARFCPQCLFDTGGRWQLTWRLNWHVACPHHGCLLAELCPSCHRPQRRKAPRAGVAPGPGALCDGLESCGTNLAEHVPTTVEQPVLVAQQKVFALLDGRMTDLPLYSDAPQSWPAVLTDLKLLTQWILKSADQAQLDLHLPADLWAATAEHRQATSWPYGLYWRNPRINPSALDMASAGTVAIKILGAADVSVATQVLRKLMKTSADAGSYRHPISNPSCLTPVLRLIQHDAYQPVRGDRKLHSRLNRIDAASQGLSGGPPNSAR